MIFKITKYYSPTDSKDALKMESLIKVKDIHFLVTLQSYECGKGNSIPQARKKMGQNTNMFRQCLMR